MSREADIAGVKRTDDSLYKKPAGTGWPTGENSSFYCRGYLCWNCEVGKNGHQDQNLCSVYESVRDRWFRLEQGSLEAPGWLAQFSLEQCSPRPAVGGKGFEVGNEGGGNPNTGCPSGVLGASGQLVSGHVGARKRGKSEDNVTFINIKIHT